MSSARLTLPCALTLLLASTTAAHAWDVEEDSYSSGNGDDGAYSTGELPPSADEGAPPPPLSDDSDSESESDGEPEALPPPPPPLDDAEGDEDLYPRKRPAPSSYDEEEEDDDGWAPAGAQRYGEAARQEVPEDEGDSPTDRSFFGAKNLGLTAELTLGGLFRQGSLGSLEGKFGLGLAVSWNLGRMLFDPELKLLHKGLWLELAWLHPFSAGGEEGTEMTRVTQSQNNLSLAVIFGYPVWRLLPYVKFGPALYVGGLDYDVDGSKGSWTVARGGVVYGIGVHSMFFLSDAVGLSGRIELLGHRRYYYNDLQLTVGLGAAF